MRAVNYLSLGKHQEALDDIVEAVKYNKIASGALSAFVILLATIMTRVYFSRAPQPQTRSDQELRQFIKFYIKSAGTNFYLEDLVQDPQNMAIKDFFVGLPRDKLTTIFTAVIEKNPEEFSAFIGQELQLVDLDDSKKHAITESFGNMNGFINDTVSVDYRQVIYNMAHIYNDGNAPRINERVWNAVKEVFKECALQAIMETVIPDRPISDVVLLEARAINRNSSERAQFFSGREGRL